MHLTESKCSYSSMKKSAISMKNAGTQRSFNFRNRARTSQFVIDKIHLEDLREGLKIREDD